MTPPSMFDIMFATFVECLVLVGIHSYLGLHVIKRRVIFVDLSLAQIAALGATVGVLLGMKHDTTGNFLYSMLFTFVGAGIFSLTRLKKEKIPQEAIIGLVYAVAASIAIIVIQLAPPGAGHISVDEVLSGSILSVKWNTITKSAIAYLFVGIFHFVFRKKFILISENPDQAFKMGINVRFWDFLFYLSFGFVITFSVGTAGVLMVFVFLVAPAISASLLFSSWKAQLIFGWILGTIVTVLGLYFAVLFDLPPGPTVVAVYGLILILLGLILYFKNSKNWIKSLINSLLVLVAILLISGVFYLIYQIFSEKAHPQAHMKNHVHQMVMTTHKQQDSSKVKAKPKDFVSLFKSAQDYEKKLEIIRKNLKEHRKVVLNLTFSILKDENAPLFFKQEAFSILKKELNLKDEYDPDASYEKNSALLKSIKEKLENLN